jgi:hypothetical protein
MHLLIQCESFQGWEYGMLRCLEDEIVRQTGAQRLIIGNFPFWQRLNRHFAHGTRYGLLRQFLPKRPLVLPASAKVVWHVLMGPENCSLDLFKPWSGEATQIVYLFDTLPGQMKLIRRLFSGREWDVCVTSFNDAVPLLEQATGRCWHHADQAVSLPYFQPAPFTERVIHFSAYGRRHPLVHEAVLRFCEAKGLYYDFTTHDRSGPTSEPLTLFRQYAWHLSHSLFTFCWPVEVTNPTRAGDLSPITCRWFEAAAAGAVMLGQPPRNSHFRRIFGDDSVALVNSDAGIDTVLNQLEHIWQRRVELFKRATMLRQVLGVRLDWSDRVERMLEFIQQDPQVVN